MNQGAAEAGCALALLLSACHPPTLSPKELDDVYARCQAQLTSDPGPHPVTRSDYVGVRAPADPPGTPVIVYGASWCFACRVAAQYLTRRHILFVERDIEEDPTAEAALLATGAAAGLGPHALRGIPVIDVRGTVMVGFVPCTIERAWANP